MAAKLFDYTSRRVRGELRARQNRSDAATDVPSEKPSADHPMIADPQILAQNRSDVPLSLLQ